MTDTPPELTDDRDARLARAMADYLAALEADRPVDRGAFLAARPDLAADLGPLLGPVEAVQGVGRLVAAAEGGGGDAGPALGAEVQLGEFRVVRVIGRGGMGVVYEAVQEPLGRRVAVKVLPAAAAADPAHRRRFLHEARTAALLQHPHVVPVLSVGEARGVPYIAMQFVDGHPLDRVVRALRRDAGLDSPSGAADGSDADLIATGLAAGFGGTSAAPDGRVGVGDPGYFRRVAELGVQAADALAYAHEAGVVHRDVKPGNLLLDVNGHLWLCDFGLARAAAAGVTSAGRVGTLRYMSPEQAAGEAVDPRADVYALGVTLYELLGLRPPFAAATDTELLRQVAAADPPPLRRHNPAVPVDLEIVVHKAMAKLPRDRYATAAALADDLRRFRDGLPVMARPLSRVQRWRRWAGRRRKPLLAGGLVLAAGLVLGLSASTYLVWRAYRAERAERERADRREALLRDMVTGADEMELLLRHQPGLGAGVEHRKIVRRLKTVWCELAAEPGASVADQLGAVRACVRLGEVEAQAGDGTAWAAANDEAADRLRRLYSDAPGDIGVRYEWARMLGYIAQQRFGVGDPARGTTLREAVGLFEGLTREFPDRSDFGNLLSVFLGTLAEHNLGRGEVGEAENAQRRAIAADEKLRDSFPTGHPLSYMRLVWSWQRMAQIRVAAGNPAGAEEALRTAVGYDDRLAGEYAGVKDGVRGGTIHARAELGALLVARGSLDEARPLLDGTAGELSRLAADHPMTVQYRVRLAACRFWLGQLEHLAGRPDAARAAFAGMLDAQSKLPESFRIPFVLPYQALVPLDGVVEFGAVARALEPAARAADGTSARVWRGFALLRAGRSREAAAEFTTVIGRQGCRPLDAGLAGYGLAVCHARTRDRAAADRAWAAAESLDPLRYATDARVRIARAEAAAAASGK